MVPKDPAPLLATVIDAFDKLLELPEYKSPEVAFLTLLRKYKLTPDQIRAARSKFSFQGSL